MAGYTSDAGNPLLADFILVGLKLERLGFTCYRGKATIIEPFRGVVGSGYFLNCLGSIPDCFTIAKNVPIGKTLLPPCSGTGTICPV